MDAVINKETLLKYDEEVSKLKFAIQSSSNNSDKVIEALRKFLKEWLGTAKYSKTTIDSQNFYFSKKTVEQFISILKDNLSLSQETLSSYIDKALSSLNTNDFFFSNKDVSKFKEKIIAELNVILEEFKNKKEETSSKNKKEDVKKTESYRLIKKKLYTPNIDVFLNIIPKFLEKNVFSNFSKILQAQSRQFDISTLKIIKSKHFGSKNIFTTLWVPNIKQLKSTFKRFEAKATRGLIYKISKKIKALKKKTGNAIDLFFPVKLISGILVGGLAIIKVGLKIVTGILNVGIKIVSFALKFATSTIKFVTSSISKIGSTSIKLLSKTLIKIGKSKLFKITANGLFLFFKTHAGAYLLGFIIGRIYRNFKKIIEFVTNAFKGAKKWFTENIYDPWLKPIFKWFEEDEATQMASLVVDEFKEGGTLWESVSNVGSIFDITDSNGRKLIKFNFIKQKLDKTADIIVELFSSANLSNTIISGVGTIIGGQIGAWAGAVLGTKLGAAAGSLICPGLGTAIGAVVGGITGALGGGFFGEELGNKISKLLQDNVPYTKLKRHKTDFERYSEDLLGGKTKYAAGDIESVGSASFLDKISRIGRHANEIDFYEDSDLEELEALSNFGVKTGIDFERIRALRSSPIDASEYFSGLSSNLAAVKNINKFSYDRIFAEIQNAAAKYGNMISKFKGIATREKIAAADPYAYTTSLTLDGVPLNFQNASKEGFNPYLFRIIRGTKILDLMQMLSMNKIPLFGENSFYEAYTALNSPESLIQYKSPLFGNEILGHQTFWLSDNDGDTITNLIFPYRKLKEKGYALANNNPFINEIYNSGAAKAGGIGFVQDNANWSASSFIPRGFSINDKYQATESGANAFLKAVWIHKKEFSDLGIWIPRDENQGWWSKRFDNLHIAAQDYSKGVIKNTTSVFTNSSQRIGRFDENYIAAIDNLATSGKYDRTILGQIDKNKIAQILLQRISEQELREAANDNSLSRIIESAISSVLDDKEFTIGDFAEASIGALLMNSIAALSNGETSLTTSEAIDEFSRNQFLGGIAILLERYQSTLNTNNEFLKNKILEFLKSLINSGMSAQEINERFGVLVGLYGVTPADDLVTESIAGGIADPSN